MYSTNTASSPQCKELILGRNMWHILTLSQYVHLIWAKTDNLCYCRGHLEFVFTLSPLWCSKLVNIHITYSETFSDYIGQRNWFKFFSFKLWILHCLSLKETPKIYISYKFHPAIDFFYFHWFSLAQNVLYMRECFQWTSKLNFQEFNFQSFCKFRKYS